MFLRKIFCNFFVTVQDRSAAFLKHQVKRDLLAVIEPNGAPVSKAVFGQDVLHFLIVGVCVHPDTADIPAETQLPHQIECHAGDALAPVFIADGHAVDHGVRRVAAPLPFQVQIGGLAVKIDAEISRGFAAIRQELALLVLQVPLDAGQIRIAGLPLVDPLGFQVGFGLVDERHGDAGILELRGF